MIDRIRNTKNLLLEKLGNTKVEDSLSKKSSSEEYNKEEKKKQKQRIFTLSELEDLIQKLNESSNYKENQMVFSVEPHQSSHKILLKDKKNQIIRTFLKSNFSELKIILNEQVENKGKIINISC